MSDTDFFPLISHNHAVMNFADKNWYLSDNGSKNGTSISHKDGKKCLLAPGEPIVVRRGDKIFIADEVVLVAK